MEQNYEFDEVSIVDLLEKRLQLQIENLKFERASSNKKWYRKTQWWAAVFPGIAVLLVGIGTVVVAFLTGYFNSQKTLNENTNVLLEGKKIVLQLEIDTFQRTKQLLVDENNSLRSNSEYLQQRIRKSDETKMMYDSAIKMQKGTIAQRNKYVAGLLAQVSNLKDHNQQLTESISKLNATTAGLFLNGSPTFSSVPSVPLDLNSINTTFPSISSIQSLNLGLPPNTINNGLVYLDSNGFLKPGSVIGGTNGVNSLSSPLYIQDTSSAIYKILHSKN